MFIGATVARSGSRGGFVGLMAVGGALLVMTGGVSIFRKVFVIAVAVTGLVLWAPEGYWKQMQTIRDPKADYNYNALDGRRNIGLRGIQYMKDNPIFGVGISNFQKAECTISDKARNTPPGYGIRCMPPHNSYIQAGAETGVTGLVLWASVIFGGVISLRRWGRKLPRRFRTGTEEQKFLYFACQYLPVALVGFGVTSYFLTFAWLEPYYMLLALTAGTIQLARQVTGVDLEPALRADLRRAPSNVPELRNGEQVWEKYVLPDRVTLDEVAAHLAQSALFRARPIRKNREPGCGEINGGWGCSTGEPIACGGGKAQHHGPDGCGRTPTTPCNGRSRRSRCLVPR